MFKEVPVRYFGCTHRAVPPEVTIENVKDKLKSAGVTRVTDITHLDRVGIHVFSAIRPSAAEGAVSIYAGKGATKDQAKASAMMEAFERYSAEPQSEDIVRGIYGEMDRCINPRSLILPDLPFDPEKEDLNWIKAVNIHDNSDYLIPVNSVFHPSNFKNGANLFKSNTNGLASGNRIEEAIFHGITEVVERDAWSIYEISRNNAPEINLENCSNPLIEDILQKFKKAGINIKVLDLTSDVEMTTIAAVSDDTILKDPALLTLGVGTHLDPEIAVLRALTEVAQSRATQIHGTREDTTRAVIMRKAGYQRMKRINKHWFGESESIIELNEIRDKSGTSFKEDIHKSMKLLKKAGFEEVLYFDLTRPEIDIPVVRVIIPGMEVYSVDPERKGKRLARHSKAC